MRPVERQSKRVHRIEITEQDAYPFLRWFDPLLRWFHIDEFPAGPFLIVCTIIGGVANYWTGSWLMTILHRDEFEALMVYIVVGMAVGMGIAVKFINWLADHSPD